MNNKKNNALAVWQSYDTIKKTQKELEKLYKDSLETIKQEMQELKVGARGNRTATYDLRRLKQAKQNIKKELNQLRKEVGTTAKKGIAKAGKTQNIKLNRIRPDPKVEFDPKRLETLLNQPWKGSKFSERIWNNIQTLEKSILLNFHKGVVLGKTIDETAVLLAKDMHISLNQSRRLVRTETMRYLSNENLRDMYERGYTQVQEVVTIDERTSSECAVHQAQIHSIENAPELPRHPNCRCCLIPVISTRLNQKEAEERLKKSTENKSTYENKAEDFKLHNPKDLEDFFKLLSRNWEEIERYPKKENKFELLDNLKEIGFDNYLIGTTPSIVKQYGIDEDVYLNVSDIAHFLNKHKGELKLEHYYLIEDMFQEYDLAFINPKENKTGSFGFIRFIQSNESEAVELIFERNPYNDIEFVTHFQYFGKKSTPKRLLKLEKDNIIIDKRKK